MTGKIITISRQFGSGGHTIGRQVAEKLGIPCYDMEVLQKIAEQSGFTEKYVKSKGDFLYGGWLAQVFLPGSGGVVDQDRIWQEQQRIITELAEQGPCVIVGRCADVILRDKADCLRVFIHASMDYREDRIVRVYGHREKSARQRLKEKDKARAAYYKFYTDMEWGYAPNYHLTLDSGEWGLERCVEIITQLYRQ